MSALIAALVLAIDGGNPVLQVIDQQVAAWNRGDLAGFCSGYAEDSVFVSPSGVTKGRAEVLARYLKRYPDKKAMGQLTLEPLDVRATKDEVSVAARWSLEYADKPKATGHTVIVFVRDAAGAWRIVHDASM